MFLKEISPQSGSVAPPHDPPGEKYHHRGAPRPSFHRLLATRWPFDPISRATHPNVNWQDGHDGEDSKQSTADMTAFVQNLLQQMQSRFQTMSDSIMTKIDEMGNRIDELEQSINDLRAEMGVEGSPSPSVPPKVKEEPKSADSA